MTDAEKPTDTADEAEAAETEDTPEAGTPVVQDDDERRESAREILVHVHALRDDLCVASNFAAVLDAVQTLGAEAETLDKVGFKDQAAWTRVAADLLVAGYRTDEEPALGDPVEEEEEEHALDRDEDEFVETAEAEPARESPKET